MALQVARAMACQIAKEIGALATVLEGSVDAIVVTGGGALEGFGRMDKGPGRFYRPDADLSRRRGDARPGPGRPARPAGRRGCSSLCPAVSSNL